ncbi:hypothetical protein JCM10908_001363 [Rhodotorula pacifica]|uniref:uncharacterized protein n=1 Tax=Rhodotorula pacifica TaxID=1495444 RepID=UPI00316DDE22
MASSTGLTNLHSMEDKTAQLSPSSTESAEDVASNDNPAIATPDDKAASSAATDSASDAGDNAATTASATEAQTNDEEAVYPLVSHPGSLLMASDPSGIPLFSRVPVAQQSQQDVAAAEEEVKCAHQ